ncbi:EAL domain, c-di-GMP-specific phosphodiesterase class I (or its enzymatically inactive variant) [Colwellia chukchiensis]|uniref:EAL domain, c-di-GMP-specific phosphodiesterase class I (Or its enzymatically inactive variant) n=1 Tax=Colwellia chukchiensis TaxID=641665 RepID=A0A1H7TV07_9GAMM|nr:EAL domain-containing response regulator [Colwellia chukchiensis]SEL88700.1 EAL domain, c-di-GMP-specific phosphodiesterase class I (or its enzymatically inactive variant) [Colwellia chukchiensis]
MNIKKVLIIEDDRFQVQLMTRFLEKLTHASVQRAANGQEALSHLNHIHKPDLIFCDLNMPKMDGIEFLRKVSQQKLNSQIVITSVAETEVLSSVIKMADTYGLLNVLSLKKPINYKSLESLFTQLEQLEEKKVDQFNVSYQASDQEIINGLQYGQFVPFFQPHINATNNQICGAEALVRWQHPKIGVLSPDAFLKKLTKLGLINKLTLTILDLAIATCVSWHQQGTQYRISVNVSPLDLTDLNFADRVFEILNHYQLPAKYLTLEITETEICNHLGKALETMSRLRIKGVEISIDDFGTGSSSMLQLITSPFRELKVDQFFVRNMFVDPKSYTAVKASLYLAKHLNLRSVAEGVETEEQAKELKHLGCNILQGYNYSPALPAEKFLQWCQHFQSK